MNKLGWAGRIRTCECWDQNPVPYRLATAQSFSILAQLFYFVEEVGLFEVAAVSYSGATSILLSRLFMRAESSTYFCAKFGIICVVSFSYG